MHDTCFPPFAPGPEIFPDPCHHRHVTLLRSSVGMGPRGQQGPKGDTFTFDDLTPSQLASLRRDVASVYYRLLQGSVQTTSGSTTTIEIPVDYSDHDILFVDVNGLDLVGGTDYTVSNGSIVLASPITHQGASVNFKVLRAIALTPEDYSALKGDKGDKGDTGGVSDYADLTNKPSINGMTIIGDMTIDALDLVAMTDDDIDEIL